ncbi:MAG: [FeFe] hydrogenase, group A [Clostridiales Family XIII bacterium]|jgi:NADH-quinone oxidoreductase subunit G|nr:[FeFe] hydrogenase, group A [Clostridiales Family XIII bacterium]
MFNKDYMIIDGMKIELEGEKNILQVIRKAGVDLPTFCYHSDLSTYGACRMCIVENKWGGLDAACSTPPKNGMEIKTNTPRLIRYRKNILKMLLTSHCRECTTCPKSMDCTLQNLARRFGITQLKFSDNENVPALEEHIDNSSSSIFRDQSKCILCGDCVRVCSETQHVGCIDFADRGYDLKVTTAFNMPISETECVNCGQCAAACPTGAITIKDCTLKVWDAVHDPTKRVIAQIAPAVRFAIGEEFGLEEGTNAMPYIVAALRRIGFDEVYDTSFSADMTVIEETNEFLKKLETPEELPLFTSCCPAWVKYVENKRPEFLKNISSCKSPQQMFGAIYKQHARYEEPDDEREVVVVSIMPCTAKKQEARRPEFMVGGVTDVDRVITTQELANMIWEAGLDLKTLEPEGTDMPFGMYSGAGLIFGVTGGVTEAVIRKVMADKSRIAMDNLKFIGVRGMEGIKEFDLPIGDGEKVLKIAVCSGLANADKLLDKIESGEMHYDFIEVMACPGGCVHGGGQPYHHASYDKSKRAEGVYKMDRRTRVKHSDANPIIAGVYENVIKGDAHKLLHVHYEQPHIPHYTK